MKAFDDASNFTLNQILLYKNQISSIHHDNENVPEDTILRYRCYIIEHLGDEEFCKKNVCLLQFCLHQFSLLKCDIYRSQAWREISNHSNWKDQLYKQIQYESLHLTWLRIEISHEENVDHTMK